MKQLGQARQQQPPTTVGPSDRVPCPHCEHPNNMTHLESQQLMDTGHKIRCDKCGNSMEVTNIRVIKFVQVRPTSDVPRAPSAVRQVRQATTISHGQLNRMLRGR